MCVSKKQQWPQQEKTKKTGEKMKYWRINQLCCLEQPPLGRLRPELWLRVYCADDIHKCLRVHEVKGVVQTGNQHRSQHPKSTTTHLADLSIKHIVGPTSKRRKHKYERKSFTSWETHFFAFMAGVRWEDWYQVQNHKQPSSRLA